MNRKLLRKLIAAGATISGPASPAPTKYRNQKTVVDGAPFDSKKEAGRWCELLLLEKAGAISTLSRQVPFLIVINGVRVCKYTADFTYIENGVLVVEDAKGVRTTAYKLKKRLMKAVHGIEIHEV